MWLLTSVPDQVTICLLHKKIIPKESLKINIKLQLLEQKSKSVKPKVKISYTEINIWLSSLLKRNKKINVSRGT